MTASADKWPRLSLKLSPGAFGYTLALVMWAALTSCQQPPDHGFLHVDALSDGTYEIYRITSESPLEIFSEQVGKFNQDVALTPGSYLVLADCSSETVVINPGSTRRLIAHSLNFVAPLKPNSGDNFSIQCSRFEKTHERQHLNNRFSLNILSGKRELLVGMVPLPVNFDESGKAAKPELLSYNLSAFRVAAAKDPGLEVPYFVSPANELISVTEPQDLGQWQFLLPGKYVVELNGTRLEVALAEKEQRTVVPAYLKVTTSDKVDLGLSARIVGSPTLVDVNDGHWLNLNEMYPVLPGPAQVSLNGSSHKLDVTLEEGKSLELKARSILVSLGCPAAEWSCLGSKNVMLYAENQPYPFVQGASDVPLLFFEDDVWLGVEGARDIRVRIPSKERDIALKLGFLKIVPEAVHHPGELTDLLRVEGTHLPLSGNSLDVNLDRPTVMPLVPGHYDLVHYVSTTSGEVSRTHTDLPIAIDAGQTREIGVRVFVTEKHLHTIEAARAHKTEKNSKHAAADSDESEKPL